MNLRKLIPLIIIAAIVVLGIMSFYKITERARVKENHVALPNLPLKQLNGQMTDLSEVKLKTEINNSIIIIYFNTECSFCQYEIEEIKMKIDFFIKTDIILISSQEISELDAFHKQYEIGSFTNISLYNVTQENVQSAFGSVSSPAIYIYDSDGVLLKIFNGETKASAIYKLLKNDY